MHARIATLILYRCNLGDFDGNAGHKNTAPFLNNHNPLHLMEIESIVVFLKSEMHVYLEY